MFKAYVEAIKPERTFFNVMMAGAGFLFACAWHVDWLLFIYTILGTSLIIMSACALNNYTDRGLDALMPRTKKRATVTGKVSGRGLLAITISFGLVGFAILAVHVNLLTCLLGLLAYLDYVVLYGWAKRTTVWSTLVGTPAGALPLAAGYTAVTNSFDATALAMCLVMVFWQMAHFYAIGVYRVKDYTLGKVPIWPVRYGVRSTQWLIVAYIIVYLLSVHILGISGNMGAVFYWVNILLGLYWLVRALQFINTKKVEAWGRAVFGNSLLLLLVFAVTLAFAPLLP